MPIGSPSSTPVQPLRLRRAPLAAAALWFAAGIALARVVFQPTLMLLSALLLLGLLASIALLRAPRVAWTAVAALWLALGMAAAEWQPAPAAPAALLPYADNLSRSVRGHVLRVRLPPPMPESPIETDAAPAWEVAEYEDPATRSGPSVSVDLAVDEVESVTPDTTRMISMPASTSASTSASTLTSSSTPGAIRVAIYQPDAAVRALACGDMLEAPLRMKPAERFRTPGAFDYAGYLLAQGIAAHASTSAGRLVILPARQAPTLACRLSAAQQWSSTRLLEYADSRANRRLPPLCRLSRIDAQMLDAMLFGDRSGLTHTLRVGFERTGSFHLFVVSGLHIALAAGALFWLCRRLRAPAWLATLVTLLGTSAYAALTGFGQPAQRALAMTAVFLLARLLARDRDSLNALGAAALAMLIWSPSSLFEASFQMTVLTIVAIAGIALPLGRWTLLRYAGVTREVFAERKHYTPPRPAQLRLMLELWGEAIASVAAALCAGTLLQQGLPARTRKLPAHLLAVALWTLELALVGVVAEMVMVLPMAFYFHRAAVFAMPANMVVIPLIGLLAPLAVATFLGSLLSSWLAAVPAAATALLLHAVEFGIHRISHLEAADVRVPGPAWPVALLAVVLWLGCCWAVRRGQRFALAAALALPLIAALVLWPEPQRVTPGTLEITALDVGQGDSLLAVAPDGQTMLIDAGGPVGRHGVSEVVSSFDVGEQVVSPYLWSRQVRRLDVVVLTHAHTDHMGGMSAVLQNFHPRELWVGADARSPLYAALLAQAARLGVVVRHLHAGDHPAFGAVEVMVLAPDASYANPGAPRNDDSLVLRLQVGRASVLLEGDAERRSEETMLAAHRVSPVTLLKVGHHGSQTSSSAEFLAAAAPRDAVLSVGRDNTFGHPRAEVITRFADRHTLLFRTDEFGLTSFFLTPDGTIREAAGGTLLPSAPPR